jgi:HK97 family phage prohead protease
LDIKNNLRAAELYSAVKRGDIDGMSFMFSVEQEKWANEDTDYPSRTIEKIAKVWEVSAVTFPAYKQTSIGARAADEAEAQKILDKIKRSGNGGNEEETQKQRLQLLIEIEANK